MCVCVCVFFVHESWKFVIFSLATVYCSYFPLTIQTKDFFFLTQTSKVLNPLPFQEIYLNKEIHELCRGKDYSKCNFWVLVVWVAGKGTSSSGGGRSFDELKISLGRTSRESGHLGGTELTWECARRASGTPHLEQKHISEWLDTWNCFFKFTGTTLFF